MKMKCAFAFHNRANAKKMSSESQSKDWKQIVVEIVLKIITLGLYHVEKRRNQANGSPE